MTATRLEAAYRAHADELVRYATAMVGPERAGDAVTDAFLRVFDDDHDRDIEHLRAYLFRAVYHRCVDLGRSRDRRRAREERDAQDRLRLAPPPGVAESQVAIDARRALSVLTDQQRAAVFLTYWCDLPPGEVAELLGVRSGTVKKQLSRARSKLREVLDV
ncbi:MAG: sigma-70 family RNA polymerase sigma factor [Ilumatobacter sp.]|nr:sigma-70 family RNA polymerase sigma factor [Ilumatobacter sp.]